MKKNCLYLMMLCVLSFVISSCDSDDKEKTMELYIASEQRMYDGAEEYCPYWGIATDVWLPWSYIQGFVHEQGYEYRLKVRVVQTHDGEIADKPLFDYILVEELWKEKKETGWLPQQRVPLIIASQKSTDPDYPYYGKFLNSQEWTLFPDIEGLDYVEGHEYGIMTIATFNGSEAKYRHSFECIDTEYVVEKESTNLPKP